LTAVVAVCTVVPLAQSAPWTRRTVTLATRPLSLPSSALLRLASTKTRPLTVVTCSSPKLNSVPSVPAPRSMPAMRSVLATGVLAWAVQPLAQAAPLIRPGLTAPLPRPAGVAGKGSSSV
jgi:hypothetical protein